MPLYISAAMRFVTHHPAPSSATSGWMTDGRKEEDAFCPPFTLADQTHLSQRPLIFIGCQKVQFLALSRCRSKTEWISAKLSITPSEIVWFRLNFQHDTRCTTNCQGNNNNNNHFISIVVKPLRRTASTHHIYTEPVLARRPEQPVTNNKV